MSKKSKYKCKDCGELLNESFYGEDMSTIYECPNENQLWHKDTKELILMIEGTKQINTRIKEIKRRLTNQN